MKAIALFVGGCVCIAVLFWNTVELRSMADDCTPVGTYLGENTTSCTLNGNAFVTLSKSTYWNLNWPDGDSNGLTAGAGYGQCTSSWQCCGETRRTECWPTFYAPVRTSNGTFSITVEHRRAEEDNLDCPDFFCSRRSISCAVSHQSLFEKSSQCDWGGGGYSGTCQYDDTGCEDCVPDDGLAWQNCRDLEAFWDDSPECTCSDPSPILVDISGNGFALSNRLKGVMFDVNNDGIKNQVPWTTNQTDDAWLALDRNDNGIIENGAELFGNFTPQPPSPNKNGFLALAEFDKPINGGNGDGQVTQDDSVFSALRLWQDSNHNGVSEPSELHTLVALGLSTLDLTYQESKKTDEFGNKFRYRAKVKDTHGAQLGRWAWDVFLVAQ